MAQKLLTVQEYADKQKIGLKAAYKRLKQDEKVKKLMVKKFGRILIKDIDG